MLRIAPAGETLAKSRGRSIAIFGIGPAVLRGVVHPAIRQERAADSHEAREAPFGAAVTVLVRRAGVSGLWAHPNRRAPGLIQKWGERAGV